MITLFKGDDTHGQLGKKCFIKFHCDDAVDMTNVRVRFNLINIVTKDFENVHDGSELEIFISHQDARKLPLGVTHGKLWGEDSSGKIRTFANRIPFIVTTDLRKVYGSDGLDSVDIHVYASVDWDSVANKPTLFPSKVSMVEGLEEALKQAGKVKTVNGQLPDENGNIEIELPSCKVTSVNGKDGYVELTSKDIPYGGEGASNVEAAIEQNTQAAVDNANAIDSLEQQVGELKSDTYTKGEVDEMITQNAAHYLTAKVGGAFVQFATHAALAAAKAAHTEANPQFWYGDDPHTPDKNDYCVVLDDETHGHATTRYMFMGEWPDGFFRYQYTVNETALTQAQWDALNSGATKEKIDAIDGKLDKSDVIDPATATTTGKAADAYETGKALDGKAASSMYIGFTGDYKPSVKVVFGVIAESQIVDGTEAKIYEGNNLLLATTVRIDNYGRTSLDFERDVIVLSDGYTIEQIYKIKDGFWDIAYSKGTYTDNDRPIVGVAPTGRAAVADGLTDAAMAVVFATPAFKTGVATALDEQVAKDKITALAEAAVENKITTEDASLVALIKKYGGTKIKEDEKGFYYEVEEEA